MDQVLAWLKENVPFLLMLGGTAFGVIRSVVRLDRRVQKLFTTLDKMEKEREKGAARNELLLMGVRATLDGMHEQGLNGPVTKAREAFDEYTLKKAAS